MAGTWVRLDVGFWTHPKIRAAGIDAAVLHLAAICWLGSVEQDDGLVPADMIDVLATHARLGDPAPVLDRLLVCRLWHQVEGGWIVHHYDRVNGSESEGYLSRQRKRTQRDKQRRDELGRYVS